MTDKPPTADNISRVMAEFGRRGGKARAKQMTAEERKERARKGGSKAAANRRELQAKAAELDRLQAEEIKRQEKLFAAVDLGKRMRF